MEPDHIDEYENEKEVEFDGYKYLVRDNGAVYRKHKPGQRKSSGDETWTFGRLEKSSRYLYIGSHAIHRIIAFAFLGASPSDIHVVDHIDMNRSNNHVVNLRWITRLDNVIRHPITRKQIIKAYGSLDEFFENPNAVKKLDREIDWLRTVSKEEAINSREQLSKWAESDGYPSKGNLIHRVYGTPTVSAPPTEPTQDIQSLTPLAVQRGWKTPAEFLSCPSVLRPDSLAEYADKLCPGSIFSRDRYKESTVVMAELGAGLISVLVNFQEENAIKPWAVSKVTLAEGKFIHEAIGTFFELNGAKKAYYQLLNIPFSGESIDDYC